jgi:hypothetical protein
MLDNIAEGAEGIQHALQFIVKKTVKPPDAKINCGHKMHNILFYNNLDMLCSCHDLQMQ